MSKENEPTDLELLKLKSHNKPKQEPKPVDKNKGTNDLETN